MKYNYLLFYSILVLSFVSCNESSKQQESELEETSETEAPELKESNAICIWDGISLRKSPSKNGKWMSSISLGENVTFTGKSQIDSTDKSREYYFVKLSDGTEGWTTSYGLVVESEACAFESEAKIYKRPDLLTITKKSFNVLDMAAIEEVNGDFVKVIGEERKKSGWVEIGTFTKDKKEVAIAILAAKQLTKVDGEYDIDNLTKFLADVPFKETNFFQSLSKILDELNTTEEPALIDEIEAELEADSIGE